MQKRQKPTSMHQTLQLSPFLIETDKKQQKSKHKKSQTSNLDKAIGWFSKRIYRLRKNSHH